MQRAFVTALVGALIGWSLVAFSSTSSADHVGQTRAADGMTVYLGVVLADKLRQHPDQYPSHPHEAMPSGKHVNHVLLALFDKSSGERITDAVVDARVSPLALVGPKRRLDPTVVAGALAYCNYFKMFPLDTYVIDAEIRRPGVSQLTKVKFLLRPHPE